MGSEDPAWHEAWLFDVVQPEPGLSLSGASFEIVLWPASSRASIHVSVVWPGRRLISLVESEAVAPRSPSTEIRSSGLWIDIGILTPFEHVTVDLEAFAVELDVADDVFAGAFGVRTPVGCELGWEIAGPVVSDSRSSAYQVPCTVHGLLQFGDEEIDIDGWGWRSHRWGTDRRPADRATRRGRRSTGEWFTEPSGEPFGTMIQRAPVPDPVTGARLQQDLGRNASGDVAWSRYVWQSDANGAQDEFPDRPPLV